MQRQGQYVLIVEDTYYPQAMLLQLLEYNHAAHEQLLQQSCIKYNEAQLVAFAFVGVITVGDLLICVFPKYYKSQPGNLPMDDFVRIIKVLRKAGAISQITPDFKNFSPLIHPLSPELILADHLIRDYLEHGLFRKDLDTTIQGGDGETNWPETIDSISPIFTQGRPVYPDVLTQVQLTDNMHLITQLHQWALNYSHQRYGDLLGYSFSLHENAVKDLRILGEPAYLINLLQKELALHFVDRNVRLLKLLIALIRKCYQNQAKGLSIFGTAYYHTIWEKVTALVFSNQSSQYNPLIAKPHWHDLQGNQVSKDTLRPDIVYLEEDSDILFILDAKYYNFQLKYQPRFDVNGEPGLGDISKQFLYEMALAPQGFEQIINLFIFPALTEPPLELSGFVTFALFNDKKIWLADLNANQAYDHFLTGKPFPPEIWLQIIENSNPDLKSPSAQ